MADFLKGFLGGTKSAAPPAPSTDDADFADFAAAPEPQPASLSASIAPSGSAPLSSFPTTGPAVPYTKWYRVWERTSPKDFYSEMFVVPFLALVIFVHVWGTRKNRSKARAWIGAHAPVLHQEFALVGYGAHKTPSADDVQAEGLLKATAGDGTKGSEELLREKSANEFTTYATGRQNVAFVDVKLTLLKRYNPILRFGELVLGMVFESMPAPEERMEATAYAFDGKESQLVQGGESKSKSTYDGFVWAVIHKDLMKRLRDDRYDMSLTVTKDHAKLPVWATIMSESAEITESLLTPELVAAIERAGDSFEALIVSDMPMDQPKRIDDMVPKKRVNISYRLASNEEEYEALVPLFHYFLRMTDQLVSGHRFRPEALRRVRQTREEEMRKIRKVDTSEKQEERKQKGDKEKKEKRDALLKGMSADEQRKYLEKEREKENRKGQKRMTMRG